jgi:hypothetical protein
MSCSMEILDFMVECEKELQDTFIKDSWDEDIKSILKEQEFRDKIVFYERGSEISGDKYIRVCNNAQTREFVVQVPRWGSMWKFKGCLTTQYTKCSHKWSYEVLAPLWKENFQKKTSALGIQRKKCSLLGKPKENFRKYLRMLLS